MSLNILLVGCGGREHAIAKQLTKHNENIHLYVIGAWDNPGIRQLLCFVNYFIADTWQQGIKDVLHYLFLNKKQLDYAIVGPEQPLTEGIADYLWSRSIPCIGPTKAYAQLESHKWIARWLLDRIPGMRKYNPQTHRYVTPMLSLEDALKYFENQEIVVKPDGLTGGKGVKVERIDGNRAEMVKYAEKLLRKNESIVIESKMEGEEFSLMSFYDGKTIQHMPPVKDFKRLYAGGPNTGGMASILFKDLVPEKYIREAKFVNQLILQCMKKELLNTTHNYIGIIYGSFMITPIEGLKVIEYNIRFGDPEGIIVLSCLKTSLHTVCKHMINQTLDKLTLDWKTKYNYLLKYIVPKTYPFKMQLPHEITLDIPKLSKKTTIYFAGVTTNHNHNNNNSERYKNYNLTGSRAIAIVYKRLNHDGSLFKMEPVINHIIKKYVSGHITFRETILDSNEYSDSYSNAGVNIDIGNQIVTQIKEDVMSTWTDDPFNYGKRVVNDYGDFAGIYSLNLYDLKCYQEPLIVATTDGIGTKTLLTTQIYGPIGFKLLGQDIVNNCLNDMLVKGAEPMFFLDYVAQPKLNKKEIRYLISGIVQACKACNCVLLGTYIHIYT